MVNQDSISEMRHAAGAAFIASIKFVAPIFFSINQEAAALNTHSRRQLIVPELVEAEGGYVRLSRNLFWVSDGFIGELYQTSAG